MQKKQAGFSPVMLLLVLVVIGAIIFAGFLVDHKQHKASSPYPITYIKPEGTAVYEDSLIATIRILNTHPLNNGFGVEMHAKVIKIFSYQRVEGVSYPMIQEGQELNASLYSSANIGGDWKEICASVNVQGLPNSSQECSGGQLFFETLQPAQITNFITSNENKTVKADIGCGGSNTCTLSIDGLAE